MGAAVGLCGLAGLCTAAPGEVVVRGVPGGVVVARAGADGSTLERWRVEPRRRVATRHVAGEVLDVVPGHGVLALRMAHSVAVMPADLSAGPRTVWRTERLVRRVAPYQRGWLALATLPEKDGHPQAGLVYYLAGGRARRLDLLPRYNFWDLQAGDVQGDGRDEIALCTWSKTRIVPTYARRYFIFGWTGRDVEPLWRGSRLSKPYRQARLVWLDSRRERRLLSVEETRDGRRCLVAYRWNDFGFTGLGQSETVDDAAIGEEDGPVPLARIRRGVKETLCAVSLDEPRLRLRPLCGLAAGDAVTVVRQRRRTVALVVRGGDMAQAKVVAVR